MLAEIRDEIQPLLGRGRVADYIPPLARVPLDRFAMVVQTVGNEVFFVGDTTERFSIQSIAKVFSLTLAMRLDGDAIWNGWPRAVGDRVHSLVRGGGAGFAQSFIMPERW